MNHDITEQLSKLLSEFNLVAFKLQTLSESFDKLINKVDSLTAKISETKERQLIDRQSIHSLKAEQKDLESKIVRVERQIVKVQISMAEKLAWGSVGGGLSAGLIKVIEIAAGG